MSGRPTVTLRTDSIESPMDDTTKASGSSWRFRLGPGEQKSLSEVFASVKVPASGSWLRHLIAFSGPGYMISVGYMDPGNWATDIAGGSKFGYTLLSVIMLSNLMAILLQALAARLGIATGRDLAQACRDAYPRPVGIVLWIACELAIIACDLAEVIGTAIALKLFARPAAARQRDDRRPRRLPAAGADEQGFRFLSLHHQLFWLSSRFASSFRSALQRRRWPTVLAGFVPSSTS